MLEVKKDETEYVFNWSNLGFILLTQALPAQVALIFITYSWKFALLAEINQGAVPSLFALTAIVIAVTFYIKFGERISYYAIFGLVLMIPAIFFLALDKKEVSVDDDSHLTAKEMRVYGLYAILTALVAPFMWTFRAYHVVSRVKYVSQDTKR